MKQIHNTGYEIERRPLIYYRISVINDTYGRVERATPVAMWVNDPDEPIDGYDLVDGETIIGTIPAQPGSYEVGMWSEMDDGEWFPLGYEIPGRSPSDWDKSAKRKMLVLAEADRWAMGGK